MMKSEYDLANARTLTNPLASPLKRSAEGSVIQKTEEIKKQKLSREQKGVQENPLQRAMEIIGAHESIKNFIGKMVFDHFHIGERSDNKLNIAYKNSDKKKVEVVFSKYRANMETKTPFVGSMQTDKQKGQIHLALEGVFAKYSFLKGQLASVTICKDHLLFTGKWVFTKSVLYGIEDLNKTSISIN